jgi:alkanesulfonate monooxygenase SsuD/methylene tetrahydromethanopterin reductase-like flavin-dependent oxidoreductase (luciferase family)
MEFVGLGVDQTNSRALFEEQVEVMRLAWTTDDFTFDGHYFPVRKPITVLPRPLQQPHPPIWMAVQSETSLDWAAAHDCNIILSGSSTEWDQLPVWTERYLAHRRAAAHDSGQPPRIGILRHVFVSESDTEAHDALWQSRWQRAVAERLRLGEERITGGLNSLEGFVHKMPEDTWWDRIVYGTPERCIDQLRRDAALGVTDLVGWFDIGGLPAETVERSMRLFADKVAPALTLSPSGTGLLM